MAGEVRGGFVRPDHDYVLLSPEPLSGSLPAWITTAEVVTEDVHAYAIRTPPTLDTDDLSALNAIGVGAVTEVEIRPTGLVPALWDGEGTAEWFLGETPLLAIPTSRAIGQAIFTVDSDPRLIPWPDGGGPMFVRVEDLDAGVHDVTVSLIGAGADEKVSEGSFQILIRPPAARPAGGSIREGLMILPTPVSPSLDELWDGKAVLEVLGPKEVEVTVEVSLFDRSQRPLARGEATASLPVDRSQWLRLFASRFRTDATVHPVYDEAEACEVAVRHPALGRVSLRAERTFAPLRWAGGEDRDGAYVRLVDNTEGAPVDVHLYEFARPEVPLVAEVVEGQRVRARAGGLVLAHAGDHSAAVILPREVHSLGDIRLVPELSARSRSLPDVLQLVGLARLWASASLTVNPIGEWARYKVLTAITSQLCGSIGGGRWAAIERRIAASDVEPDLSRLQAAIGDERYQLRLADALARQVTGWAAITPEARAGAFAACLSRYVPWMMRVAETDNRRMPEFLLRLASEPASLAHWPLEEVRANLQQTLESPVLLRAARFGWFAVEAQPLAGAVDTVGRWTWR